MSAAQNYAFVNASAGWNGTGYPPTGAIIVQDQWVAIGWIEWLDADPETIAWLVQGYYTVGRDMVKGY